MYITDTSIVQEIEHVIQTSTEDTKTNIITKMRVTKHPEHDSKDIFPSRKNDDRISDYSEGVANHKQHKGKNFDFESNEDFDKSNIDPDFDIKPQTSIQKDKRSIERKTNETNINVLEQNLRKVCKSSIFEI